MGGSETLVTFKNPHAKKQDVVVLGSGGGNLLFTGGGPFGDSYIIIGVEGGGQLKLNWFKKGSSGGGTAWDFGSLGGVFTSIGGGVIITWIGGGSTSLSVGGGVTLYLGAGGGEHKYSWKSGGGDSGCVVSWKNKELKCGGGKFQPESPARLASAILNAGGGLKYSWKTWGKAKGGGFLIDGPDTSECPNERRAGGGWYGMEIRPLSEKEENMVGGGILEENMEVEIWTREGEKKKLRSHHHHHH
nr:recombinant IgG-specific dengue multiepitope protein [synthetic construct]